MDEMTLLASMRSEIPFAPPSQEAERLFRAGQAETGRPERVRPTRPWISLLTGVLPGVVDTRGRSRWWRLAVPGLLAIGLTAALVALLLPQGAARVSSGAGTAARQATPDPAAGTTMSAQLLADIAGQAVLAQQPVKPEQWVYQKVETYSALPPNPLSHRTVKPAQVQNQWVMADGADEQWGPVNGHLMGGLVLAGPAAKVDEQALASAAEAYSKLGSLPKNPAALEAYFAHQAREHHPTQAALAENAYSTIQNMLSSEVLPPSLTAELYHALADVPGVVAKKNVTDVAGRPGVEFILPQHPGLNTNLGTILSATTYQYLGQVTWAGNPPYVWEKTAGGGWRATGDYIAQVLLDQALVPAPGKLP